MTHWRRGSMTWCRGAITITVRVRGGGDEGGRGREIIRKKGGEEGEIWTTRVDTNYTMFIIKL